MDIVLLKDVERLGSEGNVVHVKPGYARNHLFPRGLAVLASPQEMRAREEQARQRAQKLQRLKAEMEAMKRKLEGRSVTLKLTVGEEDKPFGAVTANDIVEALQREGATIDKHALQLPQPIKTLGVYEVPVRLHPDVTAALKVWVVKA